MKILIAEDNTTNRKIAMKLVESLGHEVDSVENGFDAVEKARDGEFDLVLMDVQMPVVDGREATRRIREFFPEPGTGPKIIAVTANSFLGEKESCLKAGMDAYLTKPLQLSDLEDLIGRA